jgi:SET domain-containing protein
MNTPEEAIKSLRNDVYCRLMRSTIAGIGVVAIKHIPNGTNPFPETRHTEFLEVPVSLVKQDPLIPDSVKQLVKDMCPEDDGQFYFPQYSLNELGIGYFINHSKTPNMTEHEGDFFAARDIEVGEELTVDYETYGALNL